jgi:hypothetical protein
MIWKYETYFEERLGFPLGQADVTLLHGAATPDAAARYLVRRGESRYFLSIPAPVSSDDARPPRGSLAQALSTAGTLLAGTAIAATVPRIAVVGGREMPPAVVESAFPGTAADGWIESAWPLSRVRTRRLADLAGAWLLSFQAATRCGTLSPAETAGAAGIDRDLERLLDSPAALDRESRDALARLGRAVAADRTTAVPVCAAHGNFVPRSLVLDGGRIVGVARWESFRGEDHPLTDAWDFLLDAAPVGGPRLGATGPRLVRHLLGGGWYRRLADDLVARVCRAHGMVPSLARTFLALHLVRGLARSPTPGGDEDGTRPRSALLKHLLLFESEADGWVR